MASFSFNSESILAKNDHNDFRERLRLFYKRVDPPKILNIDQIVNKHHARQQALFNFLAKKYNVDLKEILSQDEGGFADSTSIAGATSLEVNRHTRKEPNYRNDRNRSFHMSNAPLGIVDDEMRLDFCGQHFDPLFAISHPDRATQHLPAPRVRPLDNISKCCVLLPESDPNYREVKLVRTAQAAAAAAAAETLRAKRKKEWEDAAKTDPRMLRGLPDRLAARFRRKERILVQGRGDSRRSRHFGGSKMARNAADSTKMRRATNVNPLNLLESCYRERRRIRVFIRGAVGGVKGSVAGYLKVFDKHMNIVLADADEEVDVCVGWDWIARPEDAATAMANGGVLSAKARRRLKKVPIMKKQRRHLHQSFIRGCNVVIVQALDD